MGVGGIAIGAVFALYIAVATIRLPTGASLQDRAVTPEVVVAIVSPAGFVVGALLMALTALIARPKYPVPPVLRGRPGLLGRKRRN